MSRKIGRREFFKTSAQAGLTLALGPKLLAASGGAAKPSIIAVGIGSDYEQAAMKAVQMLGGIKKFVPKGSKVALLPNVQSRHPGSFTKPQILRAVIRLCKKAGAKEVSCLSWQTMKQWEDTGLKAVVDAEGAGLKIFEKDEALFKPVPIAGGQALKEARILAEFYEYDVFINMPITKDHAGNKFTGTMKNLMGLNQPTVNRAQFHKPNWKTDPNDIAHLEKCIVDLNFAAKPALNIVDATEIIKTNGPMGPGEIVKPGKIVAGVDRVAIDSYCATILGFKGEEIVAIKHAAERKLGEIDLQKAGVREVAV